MSYISSNTANKPLWSGHHPLRRQKSNIEMLMPNSNTNKTNRERTKLSVLQKQLSIDSSSIKQTLESSSTSNVINNNNNNGVLWNGKDERPESSLRILGAVKKRPQGGGGKNEQETTDRVKKALKDRGNRLNLNIFLSHGTASNQHDQDINSSDVESPSESIIYLNKENNNNKKEQESSTIAATTTTTATSTNQTNNNKTSTAITKRSTSTTSELQPQTQPMTQTIRSRPPLVRAMSAPIRPLDDSSKILQGRKKLRRKKVTARERDDFLDNHRQSSPPLTEFSEDRNNNGDILYEDDEDDTFLNVSSDENKMKMRPTKKGMPRARSALGCDIVTLVSLLSSGGSDSEKEETNNKTDTINNNNAAQITNIIANKIRAPMLRKTGKSVSFQENDELHNFTTVTSTTTKDFSSLFRRGSVAPLAARIRANRPPTAPPGSIYLNSEDTMTTSKDTTKNSNETKTKKKDIDDDDDDINLPDNVRSPKEKECWKLFQKMSKRGVAVSYDTILRGMLTPTELRVIQKQNEAEEAAKLAAAAEEEEQQQQQLNKEETEKSGSTKFN